MIFLIDYANIELHSIDIKNNLTIQIKPNTVRKLIKYGVIGYIEDPALAKYLKHILGRQITIQSFLPTFTFDDPLIVVYKTVDNLGDYAFIFEGEHTRLDNYDFVAASFYLLE